MRPASVALGRPPGRVVLARHALRGLLGIVIGVVVRAWMATLRVHVTEDPALDRVRDRPWVLAFWHGDQWSILAWPRRRKTVVLVSLSADGAMQAKALGLQGLRVVRGSSSRGGARGLIAVVRALRRGGVDAAFAVDGPRGPRGEVKGGAIMAARAAGAVVVPAAGAIRHGVVLRRTWDRFALAWPFGRIDVALGAPVDPCTTPDARAAVSAELARLSLALHPRARSLPPRSAPRAAAP